MEPLGIMLYGYGKEDSACIMDGISGLLQSDVSLISASEREDRVIMDILRADRARSRTGIRRY